MLNDLQLAAVNSTSDKILCLAGAGTGKTRTMLARVSKLLEVDGVDPANILVLTFTNAAAFEMKTRHAKEHEGKLAPLFCTFHSFCYSLIVNNREIRQHLGYGRIPNIPDDETLKRLQSTVKQQCNIKLSDKKLAGGVLTQCEQFQFDLYWKQYKKQLKQKNYITFDMMCYDVCKLFEVDDDLIQIYKERYEYIFVDEFQDTDPLQWEFVKSFKGANLFVVGDVFQAIYGFRGADNSIIKSLAESPEWETIKMDYNYRSTKQICEYANNITKNADQSYKVELRSDKSGNGVFVNESTRNFEYNLFAIDTSDDIAILCRTNAEVDYWKTKLSENGILYNSNRGTKHLDKLLNSALSEEYAVNWLSSLLPAEKYAEYIRLCSIDSKYSDIKEFILIYNKYEYVLYKYSQILRIKQILKEIDNNPNRYTVYAKILDVLDIAPNRLPDNRLFNTTDPMTSDEVVNYMIANVTDTAESNIYIDTIHSVKGLEFNTVYLLGAFGKTFRITAEENMNLYYVACTRAKSNLIVYKDA